MNLSIRSLSVLGSLLLTGVLITSFVFPSATTTPRQSAKDSYLNTLAQLDSAVAHLHTVVQNNSSEAVVQNTFRQARMAYKRVEFLTEFYFSGSAKALNGPPLPEGEVDDGVATVFEPHGFQVIEELIFPLDGAQHTELLQEIALMQTTITQLRRVARYNEMTEGQIFDAMRLEVDRLITLGITGFDSPIAQYSLPEAIAALESIDKTLALFPVPDKQLHQTIVQTIRALRGRSFNRFDRLTFIRDCAYPLSRQLLDAQLALGYPLATDKRMLRQSARTLSDTNAFDPTFFQPYGQPKPTESRITLGKMLFFNPVLSGNGQRTCASCHRPDRAFTDGEPSPLTLDAKKRIGRNTPTLVNAAFQSFQFMDSRSIFLEDQIVDVVHNMQEMGGSLSKAVAQLQSDSTYKTLFSQAYSDGLTESNLKNALAAYVRSLVSLNTRTDRYLRGEPVALTKEEKAGFTIFMGKGKCATCHFFPLYNGTIPPAYIKTESEVLGTPATIAEQEPDADAGRYQITKISIHQKAFKTPTVRHVALTAPYMHNGVYQTLEQVVEFYNKGGGTGLGFKLDNQTLPFDKLSLTAKEKRALVAFMKTL